MSRIQTLKLTQAEWTALIMAAVLDIGEQPIRDVVRQALGDTRYTRLVVDKQSTRTTKQENHAMVRGIYPFLPGTTRADKERYLIDLGRKVFADDQRVLDVLAYVKSRVAEHEDAGGTIEDFPLPPETQSPLTGKETGFLWKPVSESDGRLVVLLPSTFTHRTSKRADLVADGKVIDSSRLAHDAAEHPNGNREHYRFGKPGRAYPSGVQLRITADAHTYTWTIANPANRHSGHASTSAKPQTAHPAHLITTWYGGVNMSGSTVDPAYRLAVTPAGRDWSDAPASWRSGHAGPGGGHDAIACCAAAYQRPDGTWVGGKYEWHIRPARQRNYNNIRAGYGGWVAPPSGTPILVWAHTADGNRISTPVNLIWP